MSEETSQNLHFNAKEVTLIGETFSRQPVQPRKFVKVYYKLADFIRYLNMQYIVKFMSVY